MQAVTSVFACVDNIHVGYDSFFFKHSDIHEQPAILEEQQ